MLSEREARSQEVEVSPTGMVNLNIRIPKKVRDIIDELCYYWTKDEYGEKKERVRIKDRSDVVRELLIQGLKVEHLLEDE